MAVPLTGLPPLPLGLIWCTAHENARIRAPAAAAAISFGHEMNGYWYPWGFTGTTAAQFVAAWRRIHGLFAAAGASNVIWVWNPNVISAEPQLELSAYYPGDEYVDWVGVTGYFAATGADTFDGLYGPNMQEIRRFTPAPCRPCSR